VHLRSKGRFGPGLVFFFSAMGPGTFLTSAVAGATYGYALLWALGLALLFRFVWVNVAASYVLVTRESLLQGYARIGQWWCGRP
jgi:Mn2+/Fe2+ NRAMP family transporter